MDIKAYLTEDQSYYWSREWQEFEHQALADLVAGHARIFTNSRDAVHYLLGDSRLQQDGRSDVS
jgi:hypothetical protein